MPKQVHVIIILYHTGINFGTLILIPAIQNQLRNNKLLVAFPLEVTRGNGFVAQRGDKKVLHFANTA